MFTAGASAQAASSVQVTLPAFEITLNGVEVDNMTRQYPLIVYRGITYFPMTYHDTRFLGLEADYSAERGLEISKTGVVAGYRDNRISGANPLSGTARIAAFSVQVNGKPIDNPREAYPLLIYRDITYFPMTWRFAVEEFGWEYSFDHTNGLVINSYSYEELSEMLKVMYGPNAEDIVNDAGNKLRTSEWLTSTFIYRSRRENRVHEILKEHIPSGTKWYMQAIMTEADDGDNTGNPTITEHYLLLDGVLYYSDNGMNWRTDNIPEFSFPESPDVPKLLNAIPPEGYDYAVWELSPAFPRLIVGFVDELPWAEPPVYVDDDSKYLGGVDRHRFDFNLQERALRSYWVSTIPLILEENGEVTYVAVPTVFYSVVDFDYQPITFPSPLG